MLPQTVLPFKLETTNDVITAHAGLALVGEFMEGLGLTGLIDRSLPGPGSAAGYAPSQYVVPAVLLLHGGGRTLEDLRQLREDRGLREVLGLTRLPSSDAMGDWLRRMGSGEGLAGLGKVCDEVVRRTLNREERTQYTLDIDATQIVAEKQEAKWTYKNERGYMPMVGHLAENGVVIGDEFREGNQSPGSRNLAFVKQCVGRMPRGKRIGQLRADAASYQAELFNWCEEVREHGGKKVRFAIGGRLDEATKAAIEAIPAEAWRKYEDGAIAETVHSMEKTKQAFRLVVVRRPVQPDLFGTPIDAGERYKAIASNREETAEETVAWYNRRGECSENRIKEVKNGFGMERMPCGQFEANALWFRLGALAYNLFVLFVASTLPEEWSRRQVRTVRWRLFETAGKVARHAGRLMLKVSAEVIGLFEEVRTKTWELATA